ncbi:MAG: hypothetical protein WB557_25100 [Solirubrobacteraceae bacterium]
MASRTLVKSPPELWAECSDAASLARHLDQFGEIRITRLEPETAVAWEGEHARGTVRIEPSGWGTKVILTAVAEEGEVVEPAEVANPVAEVAEVTEPETVAEPIPEVPRNPEPDPEVAVEAPPARRRRFRWFSFLRAPRPDPPEPEVDEPVELAEPEPPPEPEAVVEPETVFEPEPDVDPEPVAEPEPEPAPERESGAEAPPTEAALTAALDSLGQAHHRPYSRA